jgi:type III secretory pathway component EscV
MICKELNEESSIRKQEAVTLEADVCEFKKERDSLATQVQQLRAEVSLHKQEKQEHRLLRETLTQYENGSLDRADEGIRARDELIADLSVRLERTMETLEMERELQRQRRQIIFPVAKSTPEIPFSKNVAALEEELRIAKEAATFSQNLLEASKKEAAQREATLIAHCEELARRLKKDEPPEKGL